MKKSRIGSTDIEVSLLGLGTVKIGRNEQVKYPLSFTIPTDKEVASLLDQAQSLGINLIDTAPAYGSSEERLGKLLKNRHDWVLFSKAGEFFSQGKSAYNFTKKSIIASVENSLRTLKTDYLDGLLIHSNGDDIKIIEQDGVFETLATLKQKGWIRCFGMSTKTIEGGKATIDYADLAMVTYNVNEQDEKSIIDYANEKQKGIFVKKGLASGRQATPEGLEKSFTLLCQTPGVSSVIIGTITPNHLANNVMMMNQFTE